MGKWVHRVTTVDTESRTGICAKCGRVKVEKRHTRQGGVYWRCTQSYRDDRRTTRPYTANEARIHVHLVGECEICGQDDTSKLVVDHIRDTTLLRGILCHNCNVAIGHLRHDTNLLKKAIEYLQYWEEKYDNLSGT